MFKISFWEVYCRIYGRKLSFMATLKRSHKIVISKYIRRYTSPNENFEYGYPHSNALLQFYLNSERYMPHKAIWHLTKCDVINDVKLFPRVYREYITGYTGANFLLYPIRRRVTKASE